MSEPITDIMQVLTNERICGILQILSKETLSASASFERFGLTRRQYYEAIKKLKSTGLISKIHNNYHITTFGKIIYNYYYQNMIYVTEKYRSFLLMMDKLSIEMPQKYAKDREEVIVNYIKEPELLEIVLKSRPNILQVVV